MSDLPARAVTFDFGQTLAELDAEFPTANAIPAERRLSR